MLPQTFNELGRKTKYNFACAIFRNSKDGDKWRKSHKHPHELVKYLTQTNLNPNLFQRHYGLKFNIKKENYEQ